jgi:hypothetical protein
MLFTSVMPPSGENAAQPPHAAANKSAAARAPAKGARSRSKAIDTRRQAMSGHELRPQT